MLSVEAARLNRALSSACTSASCSGEPANLANDSTQAYAPPRHSLRSLSRFELLQRLHASTRLQGS